ncbi:MAG: protein SCO1/2 [Saprospiraceae bacterium]|jgi:protein SCO1/2
MRRQIYFLVIVFLVISCGGLESKKELDELPFFNSASFTPEWIQENEQKHDSIHVIANFSLINQDGKIVNNETFNGHVYVANFFFTTCPGLCPRLSSSMKMLQDSLMTEDVLLVSHTVMPSHDSVGVLLLYAESKEVVSGKWHLLTGDKEKIYKLARESYFADEDFEKTQKASGFIHTENILLVDSKGRIRGVYNGTLQLEMLRLLEHIKILQKET